MWKNHDNNGNNKDGDNDGGNNNNRGSNHDNESNSMPLVTSFDLVNIFVYGIIKKMKNERRLDSH